MTEKLSEKQMDKIKDRLIRYATENSYDGDRGSGPTFETIKKYVENYGGETKYLLRMFFDRIWNRRRYNVTFKTADDTVLFSEQGCDRVSLLDAVLKELHGLDMVAIRQKRQEDRRARIEQKHREEAKKLKAFERSDEYKHIKNILEQSKKDGVKYRIECRVSGKRITTEATVKATIDKHNYMESTINFNKPKIVADVFITWPRWVNVSELEGLANKYLHFAKVLRTIEERYAEVLDSTKEQEQ